MPELDLNNVKIVNAYCLEYIFSPTNVRIPSKLLYDDYCCLTPSKRVDIKGWILIKSLFELMKKDCRKQLNSLYVDETIGFCSEFLDLIRGFPRLSLLSMKSTCKVDSTFALILGIYLTIGVSIYLSNITKLLGSFPNLSELNISECKVDKLAFGIISTSCRTLKTLICKCCPGLDDYCMQAIANCVQRNRCLANIILSGTNDFSDVGVLALCGAGLGYYLFINLSIYESNTTI
jgi:hypothetical protein